MIVKMYQEKDDFNKLNNLEKAYSRQADAIITPFPKSPLIFLIKNSFLINIFRFKLFNRLTNSL